MNNLYGKKIFLDNQNSISLLEKLKKKYKDVSMLESVIGGDNKGRFTIIFQRVKICLMFSCRTLVGECLNTLLTD